MCIVTKWLTQLGFQCMGQHHICSFPVDCMHLQYLLIFLCILYMIAFAYRLFVFERADVLITYYCNTTYSDFRNFWSEFNIIVYIRLFSMEKYNLFWIVKDIVISIACISYADVLNEFGILFLHQCLNLMYVKYILCIF